MMRSDIVEIINGYVDQNGKVIRGSFSCRRSSAGIYEMYTPPGRIFLNLVACCITPAPQWSIIAVEISTGAAYGCRVVVANAGGTVNVDSPFLYIATLSA